ncbi:c-type cytochrome [Zoogloea sp. LCSB751]|uniref:c-type cytochrome n=1 Tax=Zoogloea sp. LCSB751 TaxID=1965277 RepID=UPI0020B14EE6|nr:c-type cytochrome [Zoogloea sp. LCSB751]
MSIERKGPTGAGLRGALLGLLLAAVMPAVAQTTAPGARGYLERIVKAQAAEQKAAQDAGRKASFFCANCHGETGLSKYTEVPNLAGQHPAYVLNQIDAFHTGKRKDPFMQGLMKVLKDEEKADIAVFYAAQQVVPAVSMGGPRAAEGKALFDKNCARCHGAEAKGAETFPRLAGQQAEYLRRSLNRYLTMSGERIYPPMTAAVTGLGAQNIEAVVQYLSALR